MNYYYTIQKTYGFRDDEFIYKNTAIIKKNASFESTRQNQMVDI